MIERLLSRDLNVKILAALLAVGLWFFVTSEESPQPTQIVPSVEVVPRNIPEDLALVNLDPSRVSVAIRSRPSLFDAFDPADIEATIDLADATAGVAARVVKVQGPEGVEIVEVSPAEAIVALEVLAARELDVELSLEGTPGEGFVLGEPLVFPGRVRLAGAETKVAGVVRAVSAADVSGIEETIVFEGVRVFAVDEAGRQVGGVSVTPETVRIVVPVEAVPAEGASPGDLELTGAAEGE